MTGEPRPSISFIVPARNEERVIGACLELLHAQALAEPSEIVVVDNGSTDATAIRAAAHGGRVIHEPRPGLANAREAGANAARGEFLIFIDADSRVPEGWAREIVDRFAEDAALVAVSPGFTFYDGRPQDTIGCAVFRTILSPLADGVLRMTGRPGILIGSAMAVRASALRQAGGVDLDFQFYGEDTALACRLHRAGVVRFARGPVYATSARRYQERGLLQVATRYFSMFALLQAGRREMALRLASRFREEDWRRRLDGATERSGVLVHSGNEAREHGETPLEIVALIEPATRAAEP